MAPSPLNLTQTNHSNYSSYTLNTVNHDDHNDRSPLLTPTTPAYGAANFPHTPSRPSSRKVIFNATLKMACIFAVSSIVLGGTLWLALPTLDEQVLFLGISLLGG